MTNLSDTSRTANDKSRQRRFNGRRTPAPAPRNYHAAVRTFDEIANALRDRGENLSAEAVRLICMSAERKIARQLRQQEAIHV